MKRNKRYLIESFEEQWTCPITHMPMIEPVLTLDGHSYEKKVINEWLKKQKTSPKTGLALSSEVLIPNMVLKNVIQKFRRELKREYEKLSLQNDELQEKVQFYVQKVKQSKKIEIQFQGLKLTYEDLNRDLKRVDDTLKKCKSRNLILQDENELLKIQNKALKTSKGTNGLKNKKNEKQKEMETECEKIQEKVQKATILRLQGLLKSFQSKKDSLASKFSLGNDPTKQKVTLDLNQELRNRSESQNHTSVKKQIVKSSFPEILQYYSSTFPLKESLKQSIKKKIDTKVQKIKHILPYQDYFIDYPVLYNETTGYLDHSGFKINIEKFLKHNWTELKSLNLSGSELNDRDLQFFLLEGAFFNNLTTMSLSDNTITKLPPFTFQRFKNLQQIFFSNPGQKNHLNAQSKRYLKALRIKNPSIQIRFEVFHP